MSRVNRDKVLTVADVPELPNGTATVYTVAIDKQHRTQILATIDENGVLRTLDDRQAIFPSDRCEVLRVEQ